MHKSLSRSVVSADSRFALRADLIVHDNGDLTIVVGGGSDHAGAVALALPRPSLADPGKQSATSSVLTVPGHKDDLPAREVAEKVAAATGRNVVAVAGIHYDGLEPADLECLRELWTTLIKHIIEMVEDL
jgi:hypothetical protein